MLLAWQTCERLPATFSVCTTVISRHYIIVTAPKTIICCPSSRSIAVTFLGTNANEMKKMRGYGLETRIH
jgi:hypothetical protein